jgi:hypothetical protein
VGACGAGLVCDIAPAILFGVKRPNILKGFVTMKITCAISQNIPYRDKDGVSRLCTLRPGSHNYPMLSVKDPAVAETLRVLRKHSKIAFDDLLPSDQEILKSAPPGVDRVEYLAGKVLLKPSPKGTIKKIKKHQAQRKAEAERLAREQVEAAKLAAMEKEAKESNAGRSRPKNKPVDPVGKKADDDSKPGKVSGKGQNSRS